MCLGWELTCVCILFRKISGLKWTVLYFVCGLMRYMFLIIHISQLVVYYCPHLFFPLDSLMASAGHKPHCQDITITLT